MNNSCNMQRISLTEVLRRKALTKFKKVSKQEICLIFEVSLKLEQENNEY